MRTPEKRLIDLLKETGVDFVSVLPCDRVKSLLQKVTHLGTYVPLTREEEGVGISAGAAMAGRRPAMIVQSSGIGNMINALLSLTGFYGLPLAIFVSHRGVYKERIAAQIPMGKALPGLLRAAGIGYSLLRRVEDLEKVRKRLDAVYEKGRVHAFLMSPRLWEGCSSVVSAASDRVFKGKKLPAGKRIRKKAVYTRYEVLEIIKGYLKDSLVISNLGVPSKELYHLCHQPSNFYMLGSMGMATPIGLGVSLNTKKRVYVIDGDGSILMNPGTLSTVAVMNPANLTIIAIDNAAYGSTGNQPTHTETVTDLSLLARAFGIRDVQTVSTKEEIHSALRSRRRGPRFIHVIARPGNAKVSEIPLSAQEIVASFKESLK